MDLFLHYLRMPYLLDGVGYTLLITVLGLLGGLAMGVVLAAMQLSRFRTLAIVARAYAIVFRGTPLILQMVFCYNALPLIGIKLSAVSAAGLALALNEAPFIAEILRANVLGVERGQVSAGQALGMTPAAIMRRVIAPQAIRTMVPALGNEAVSALKNSSLASVVAVQELTLRSTQLASATFDFFSIFFASGLMYLVLTGAIAVIQIVVEMLLDLDRPPPREQLRRFLRALMPGRPEALPALAGAGQGDVTPSDVTPPDVAHEIVAETAVDPLPPATAKAAPRDPAARAARLAGNNIAVEVRGLRKSYGAQTVLDGIDLTVRAGEVVALLGPSGSGKSTLLRCINRLEGWDDGTIRVGGQSLGTDENGHPLSPRLTAQMRASVGVGMVFQQFNLFGHLTARENIAGPLRWVQELSRFDADRRARDLLERIGLAHRADALPRHLSGGQQQRVAIARAVAPAPTVLLLDEPTSALDPELVGEVLEVIRRLAVEEGLAMVISTHQLRFAGDVADRIVFLSGGVIVEEGPAERVLSAPSHPLTARFLSSMTAE
ncbi:amino acid ABC transporter permease/ATP-binding protein [Ancylobacter dichloromethanicus]|uniref:ABC transporter permease n=1 Tax=Ancylobacter dichloromethanicus TaxID=518825 RepID=A0A9W6JA49_9HYPH|nr:amino acid ABC transporter permease/ATP-binding protein [Ancylobacter dichloromethanicus]MBS7554808.1 amino acid ABC transporter permease/ATP-binding protein [Ancylobacter dichloromethanicus]GLK71873.1 ABC transporter permease [Ancylobacter dichloromethanicus]